MRYTVGVSDMIISNDPADTIVTYALGSCIGVAIYDPTVRVGGILHYMLPFAKNCDEKKVETNPFMFGDTGIPILFREAYKLGATKDNLRVVIAGGAQIMEKSDFFDIGKRNQIIARKMFWKNNVLISTEHVGGTAPRTLYLEIASGKVWITTQGERIDL